jgi:hypothetical protein
VCFRFDLSRIVALDCRRVWRAHKASKAKFHSVLLRSYAIKLSVWLEVVSPLLFTFDATNGAIRKPFVCRTIIDDANRKSATHIAENTDAFDRLASGPAPYLLQTITREICPANSHGMFQEAHERFCRVKPRDSGAKRRCARTA